MKNKYFLLSIFTGMLTLLSVHAINFIGIVNNSDKKLKVQLIGGKGSLLDQNLESKKWIEKSISPSDIPLVLHIYEGNKRIGGSTISQDEMNRYKGQAGLKYIINTNLAFSSSTALYDKSVKTTTQQELSSPQPPKEVKPVIVSSVTVPKKITQSAPLISTPPLTESTTIPASIRNLRPLPPTPSNYEITKAPHAPQANIPPGLENVGNSCFMNAVIQSIFSLEKFTDAVLTKSDVNFYLPHSFATRYAELAHLFRSLQGDQVFVTPSAFCQKGWERMGVKQKTQQDSLEISQFLLDHLINEDVDPNKCKQKENTDAYNLIDFSIQTYIDNEKGILKPIKLEQTNFILSLPINNPCVNLAECLAHFFAPETIEYDGEQRTKTLQLTRVGRYFIIGLRRNEYNRNTNQLERLDKLIPFPLENLNLTPYSGSPVSPYHLKAMIIHTGSATGGHYFAYVRYGNTWYLYNDAQVTEVPLAQMQTMAQQGFAQNKTEIPTMLFYEKQ